MSLPAAFNGPTVPGSVINDGDLRVVFKIYFMVVILLTALVGGYCLKFHIRRRLLTGRIVRLADTSGWIHGPALAKITYELRRIPGGWLGLIMLLVTALEIISDFGVAKTITLVQQPARATSPSGMIIDDSIAYAVYPSPDFSPFTLATSAQIFSYQNANQTGLTSDEQYGIYRFVNGYDFNFMAMPEDIIGSWSCAHNPQTPVVYNQTFKGNATQISDVDVGLDLIKRGLIYGGQYAQVNNVSIFNASYQGPSLQLTIWSASNYTRGSTPFFTFAVETQALDNLGSKVMDVFNCSLHSSTSQDTVGDILRMIDIAQMMSKFGTPITGALYPGFMVADSYSLNTIKTTIEFYLNAVIMTAGSGQQTNTQNTQGYTYGVLEYATVIPYWIIAIAVITFALFLAMLCLLFCLWLSNRKSAKHYDSQALYRVDTTHIAQHTPMGLLGWMSYAASASRDTESPEEKNLKDFVLSTTWHGDTRLGVVRAEEHGLSKAKDSTSSSAVHFSSK